jgi:hypothetical protein
MHEWFLIYIDWNVRKHSLINTVSYSRRPESAATAL